MRRLHQRIHWTRLALVGALLALALTNRPAPDSTTGHPAPLAAHAGPALEERRAAGHPSVEVSDSASLEARYPGGPTAVEVGYDFIDALPRITARRLWIGHAAWQRTTAPRIVTAELGALPPELGPAASAPLIGHPLILNLEDEAAVVDYELSSSPTVCRLHLSQPPSTRVTVEAQEQGAGFRLEVQLAARMLTDALKVELGSISEAAIEIECCGVPFFGSSYLGDATSCPLPRAYSVALEPGQTALLPGPAVGELIAIEVER